MSKPIVLVDTNIWIHMIARSAYYRQRLVHLVEKEEPDYIWTLCPVVATELYGGVRNRQELAQVNSIVDVNPMLNMRPECDDLLLHFARKYALSNRPPAGRTRLADYLIASIAITHGAALLTADTDFLPLQADGLRIFPVA